MVRDKPTEFEEAFRIAVGKNVKLAREHAGYSQRDLCSMTGISQPYLSQLERGSWNIGIDNIVKLSRALGIAPHDLLHPQLSEILRKAPPPTKS